MRRPLALILPSIAILALAACDDSASDGDADVGSEVAAVESEDTSPSPLTDDGAIEAAGEVTPMSERVATIGLLNKRNNVSQDFEISPGNSVEAGPVIIRLDACERTAPYEFPQETGAFVQVDVLERGESDHSRIFSGWLFKENPSLNIVEHPIYDVWVKDCAMSFPGDE